MYGTSVQAQQHRTFNGAVAKQLHTGHYSKPVYSLSGRTHLHISNGLLTDDDAADEEEADEEVRQTECFHLLYIHLISFLGPHVLMSLFRIDQYIDFYHIFNISASVDRQCE